MCCRPIHIFKLGTHALWVLEVQQKHELNVTHLIILYLTQFICFGKLKWAYAILVLPQFLCMFRELWPM